MIYACTHIEKLATLDHWETGCETKTDCVHWDRCNIVADTLAGLIANIEKAFGLKFDHINVDENRISFNQLETAAGFTPNDAQTERWKQGKLKMYLCDYSFILERRIIDPIPRDEFRELAGVTIEIHD